MNFPNILTITRIILSPVFMVFILIENFYFRLIGTGIFLIAAATDIADGYFARRLGHATGFGRFMDPLADKVLVSTAFLSFVQLGYAKAWMVIIIIVREFFITGLRSLAAYKGTVISPSFLAKAKTFTQMLAVAIILIYANIDPWFSSTHATQIIIPAWSLPITGWAYNLFDVILFIPLILTVWTGFDYLLKYGGFVRANQ
jgi:CDP-diacylglycerol--glycerol-3-phosphate 3-phosphatidyltransferase